MNKKESYKIQFIDGFKGSVKNSNVSYIELTSEKYQKIESQLKLQKFLLKVERAYKYIVQNYVDFEKSIFSNILNNELYGFQSEMLNHAIDSIDRQLINVLAATHLYTSLLKIERKNSEIEDYSFDNSKDLPEIYALKAVFKAKTNEFHSEHYQYTFMSGLRHKLNHGGTLPKILSLGGSWSSYWADSAHNKDFLVRMKDQRFSHLDATISKQDAKAIIDKAKHFDAVSETMPDKLNLRESIRLYINWLSIAHAELREKSVESLEYSDKLLKKYLSGNNSLLPPSLIKESSNGGEGKMDLYSCFERITEVSRTNKAPLNLECYKMPGEYEDRPTREKQ